MYKYSGMMNNLEIYAFPDEVRTDIRIFQLEIFKLFAETGINVCQSCISNWERDRSFVTYITATVKESFITTKSEMVYTV